MVRPNRLTFSVATMMTAVAVIAIIVKVLIPRPLDRSDAIAVAVSFVVQHYGVTDFPDKVREGRYISDAHVTGYNSYWVVEFTNSRTDTVDYLVRVSMKGSARAFQHTPDNMSNED